MLGRGDVDLDFKDRFAGFFGELVHLVTAFSNNVDIEFADRLKYLVTLE
jgi:hypothetical protein